MGILPLLPSRANIITMVTRHKKILKIVKNTIFPSFPILPFLIQGFETSE